MKYWQKIFRYFEFMENIFPKRVRLPVRYWAQKFLFALEPEMNALDLLVSKSRKSIDIGANKGIYAYALSKKSSYVYCFEPLKECCEYIDGYQSDYISVTNCALSDFESEMEFFVPIVWGRTMYTRASLERPAGKYNTRNVSVNRLDMYEYENIGFIKIDVEGVEYSVLKGGENTIKKSKPNIMVEIDIHRQSIESYLKVFNYLYGLGYVAYIYGDEGLVACTGREKELGEVYYNFIFIYHENK